MPVLPTSPGDVTAVVRIAAQAIPSVPGAPAPKASSSASRSVGGTAIGAIVRASKSSAAASPSTAVTFRVAPTATPSAPTSVTMPSTVFTYNGSIQTYTVPAGVQLVFVEIWGAAGGSRGTTNKGGSGGYVSGYIGVTPGETYQITVGKGGQLEGTELQTLAWGGGGKGNVWGGGFSSIATTNAFGTYYIGMAGGGGGGDNSGKGGGGGTGATGDGEAGTGTEPGIGGVGQAAGKTDPGGRGGRGGASYPTYGGGNGTKYLGGGSTVAGGGGYGGGGGGSYWSGGVTAGGGAGGSSFTSVQLLRPSFAGSTTHGAPNGTSSAYVSGIAVPVSNGTGGHGLVSISPVTLPAFGALNKVSTAERFLALGIEQTYTVPAGVTRIQAGLWSAAGGSTTTASLNEGGGPGAFITGQIAVTPGETLKVIVGRGGAMSYEGVTKSLNAGNGGLGRGGGGGFSAIARGSTYLVVLGGGGGAGGSWGGMGQWAGNGFEGRYNGSSPGGRGGTTTAGGAKFGGNAADGAALTGGDGAYPLGGHGGGGGGGWFGGGGAAQATNVAAAGGSGSSYSGGMTSVSGFQRDLYADRLAPNNASPYYLTGVADAPYSSEGGNGLVYIFPA